MKALRNATPISRPNQRFIIRIAESFRITDALQKELPNARLRFMGGSLKQGHRKYAANK